MDKRLLSAALEAMGMAYAPYSRFHVGAAILAEDGKIYRGGNVENASYPEGICAETAAIAAMRMGGGRRIVEIAIVAKGDGIKPCGGCRQRILEFSDSSTKIHCCNKDGATQSYTMAELLPYSFGPDHLG